MVQRKQIRLVSMRIQVQSLALLSGLGIWHCHELWRRSQTRLGSCVAVAVTEARSCIPICTLSLGTSTYHGCSPKKGKKKKKKKVIMSNHQKNKIACIISKKKKKFQEFPDGLVVKDLALSVLWLQLLL